MGKLWETYIYIYRQRYGTRMNITSKDEKTCIMNYLHMCIYIEREIDIDSYIAIKMHRNINVYTFSFF